jgi:protein PhnA
MNLNERANEICELCSQTMPKLKAHLVSPKTVEIVDNQVGICELCATNLDQPVDTAHHWRCLGDSIWSPTTAVQVQSYQVLDQLAPTQQWAQDIIDGIYLDEDASAWIESWRVANPAHIIHKDSNGNILHAGDTVTLIKDLDVKGANFTAKRGQAVRNIRLVLDNAEQIEGKVNDQHIVILTQYVKKS